MHALPFVLALARAALLAPADVARAARRAATREPNYRARELPFPFGVLIVAAALLALIPLVLLERLARHRDLSSASCSRSPCTRSASPRLGLIDDTLGERRAAVERPGAARLARPRRGGAARRAVHRRAEGRSARSGSRCSR